MLLNREKSGLLLIDVQDKLIHLVNQPDHLIHHAEWLIRLASELDVITIATEQYPQGLGSTIKSLNSLISPKHCFDKTFFSCYQDPDIKYFLERTDRKQWILIGIETHVCVLQTALDLADAGYDVFVVINAVSSRSSLDHHYALKRMKQRGITLITSEMVFFEWLRQAGTKQFKTLSKVYLQSNPPPSVIEDRA